MLDFLGSLQRTQMCGELRVEQRWPGRRADGLGEPAARPRQPDLPRPARPHAASRRWCSTKKRRATRTPRPRPRGSEYVVAVKGHVRRRGAGLENPNMPTGEIEVVADELLLLNEAKTPPFSPAEDAIAQRRGAAEVSLPRPAPRRRCSRTSRCAARCRDGDPQLPCRAKDFSRSRRRS